MVSHAVRLSWPWDPTLFDVWMLWEPKDGPNLQPRWGPFLMHICRHKGHEMGFWGVGIMSLVHVLYHITDVLFQLQRHLKFTEDRRLIAENHRMSGKYIELHGMKRWFTWWFTWLLRILPGMFTWYVTDTTKRCHPGPCQALAGCQEVSSQRVPVETTFEVLLTRW
jgi:hypothetical protein